MKRARRRDVLDALDLRVTRVSFGDIVRQAIAARVSRPGRAVMTALGTVVGVAAVVATLGIATTASNQVSKRFDALRATYVVVKDVSADAGTNAPATLQADTFPADGVRRLARLNGVMHAGVTQSIGDEPAGLVPPPPLRAVTRPAAAAHAASSTPSPTVPDTAQGAAGTLPVLAADPEALRAMRLHLLRGRLYDEFHARTAEPVCVVGSAAANQLGLTRIDNLPTLWLGERPCTVIGVVDRSPVEPRVLLSVVMPRSSTNTFAGGASKRDPAEVVVQTDAGAAATIARQAPTALLPAAPQRAQSIAPPDPKQLRNDIVADVNTLIVVLAFVSLLIGGLGIANTTLVAVTERVGEIGLRRALGARRRHIALQFLFESVVIGAIGGVIGCSVAILVIVGVSAQRQWTPTLDPRVYVVAPMLGVVTGLLAGLQPAWRATHIEPTEALRR